MQSNVSVPSSLRSSCRRAILGPGKCAAGTWSAALPAAARGLGSKRSNPIPAQPHERATGWRLLDVVETRTGPCTSLSAMSPGMADEAALGVALRIAWRTLTLSGIHGEAAMRQLEQILHAEGAGRIIFATMFQLGSQSRQSAGYLAGGARLPACWCTASAPWNGPSRRPAQLWDSPATAGRSMQWNSPKAVVWCY